MVCIQHFDVLVGMLHADVAVVRDVELRAAAFLRGYFDDTGGTSRPVLGRFGGVLQDVEALDVRRIDTAEGGQVGRHTVDDDQRVVAAGQ